MNKFRKVCTSVLALLMCGAVGFGLAACDKETSGSEESSTSVAESVESAVNGGTSAEDGDSASESESTGGSNNGDNNESTGGNNNGDNNESTGGNNNGDNNESTGGNNNGDNNESTGGNNNGDSTEIKMNVYEQIANSFLSMVMSGKDVRISLDVDMERMVGEAGSKVPVSFTVDGAAYVLYAEDSFNLDAMADVYNGGEEYPYSYFGAHLRDGTLYAGQLYTNVPLTDAIRADTEYKKTEYKKSLDAQSAPVAAIVEEGGEDVSASVGAGVSAFGEIVYSLLKGINGTVVVNGDVTTLTVDIKQELNTMYQAADTIISSMTAETTVGEFLANEDLQAVYNTYFSEVSVSTIQAVMSLFMPATTTTTVEISGYEYIVEVVKQVVGEGINDPIGEEQLNLVKDTMKDVKAVVDSIQVATIKMILKNSIFTDMNVEFRMEGETPVTFTAALNVSETNYNFIDVSTLKVVNDDGVCDDCASQENVSLREDNRELCDTCYEKQSGYVEMDGICDVCGNDGMTEVFEGREICENCFDKYVGGSNGSDSQDGLCDKCGKPDAKYIEEEGHELCEKCYEMASGSVIVRPMDRKCDFCDEVATIQYKESGEEYCQECYDKLFSGTSSPTEPPVQDKLEGNVGRDEMEEEILK